MGFNKFRYKTILRVIAIATFMFAFVYAVYQEKWYVTITVCGLIVLFLLGELIYFVEFGNRELSKFLISIKYKDFSSYRNSIHATKKSSELKQAFTEISKEFQNVRIEKELHYQYLQTVFAHSRTAIICFSTDGKIQLVNEATKKLLDIKRIDNIGEIERVNPQLSESIKNIKPNTEKLVKLRLGSQLLQLSLQCTVFKLKEESYKMVSLHDVKEVLEEQELDSWKKLIRVLNHEIMNSVTPISSLSKALNEMMNEAMKKDKKQISLSDDESNDLIQSLQSIENRSRGLSKFVTNYKKITKLPQPNYGEVNIEGLVRHILRLLKAKLEEGNIAIELDIEQDLQIIADHELIEQVVINLLLNAIEALAEKDKGMISINAYKHDDHILMEISDNGKGIPDDVLDQIFVPFFTTKKEGSGIGLSISKQIMQLHRGNLTVHTQLGSGSTFILKFI